MMPALAQQMPGQTGLMAVLCGSGARPATGGSAAGFDALFADMPLAEGVSPLPVEALQQLQRAIAAQANAAPADGEAVPGDAAAPQTQPAATGDDAAAAAALLIRIATGVPATPAAASTPATVAAVAHDAETDSEDSGDAPATGDDAGPSNPPFAPVAPATPVTAAPAKPLRAVDESPAEAPALPRAAQREAAGPVADAAPAAPKTGKSFDAGASMTVLFAPPAPQAQPASAGVASTAPVAERVLDMGSDDAWIAQLAADIVATRTQDGDISFRLMPRHLGRLDVALTHDADGVSLKLDTQHEATATVVHAAQGKLVDDLRQQGVRVAGAEVTCTPGETGRQSQGQNQGNDGPAAGTHLIETAPDSPEARSDTASQARAADRRGRFA